MIATYNEAIEINSAVFHYSFDDAPCRLSRPKDPSRFDNDLDDEMRVLLNIIWASITLYVLLAATGLWDLGGGGGLSITSPAEVVPPSS